MYRTTGQTRFLRHSAWRQDARAARAQLYIQTCCNDTWKASPALCCFLQIASAHFPSDSEYWGQRHQVWPWWSMLTGRWSAIWYLVRQLHTKYVKPVGKRAVLILFGQILLSVTPEECNWSQYDLQELRMARGLGVFLRWDLDFSCS